MKLFLSSEILSVLQFIGKFVTPNLQADRNPRCFIGRFCGERAKITDKSHPFEQRQFRDNFACHYCMSVFVKEKER